MKPDPRSAIVRAIEAIGAKMLEDLPDHDTARRMNAEVNSIRLKAEALDRVARTRSPLDTPAAHALKVAKMARTFNSEVTAMINRAGRLWAEGNNDAQRRIDEKVNLKPDAFASEIRSAFRGMTPRAKGDLINRLVKENRGPELAAIVKAPAVLTGISDEARASYEKMILSVHASDELEELAKLEDVFGAVSAVSKAASSFVSDLTNPATIAAIESQATAANEASEAFSQSFTQQ